MSLSKLTIVIPTFYPGKIIKKCLASLPLTSEIIIIDNGEDLELEKIIKLQKHKIKHYKVGDVGLSKSFNIALAKSKNENILITQPDVYFEKNSIINLIKAQKKYKTPNETELLALEALVETLEKCNDDMSPENIQTLIYSTGKENGYTENLRDWFKLIYEVVFGDENGPRMGFFISFFGVKETTELLMNKLK